MATVKDVNRIYDEMRKHDLKFYKVLNSDGKTVLFSQSDPDRTTEDAITSLSACLDDMEGLVIISVSSKSSADLTTGGDIKGKVFRYEVKLGGAAPVAAIQNNNGIGMAGNPNGIYGLLIEQHKQSFDEKLKALDEKYDLKMQVTKLNDQVAELKKGDKLQDMIITLLPQFLGSAPVAKVAGTGDDVKPPLTLPNQEQPPEVNISQETARLQNAISIIAETDPNYITHLEMFAKIAKNNKDLYFMAIAQLQPIAAALPD